jgi:hypothetical protein
METLRDYIWIQLHLGYIVEPIYGKHKTIWWQHMNVKEPMMRDKFIKQNYIVYLNLKNKEKELMFT